MLIRENVPLAPLTTLHVGGAARYFAEADSLAVVVDAVAYGLKIGAPLFVFGGGSNLVVSDNGWPGLVLKIAIRGIDRHPSSDLFEVGAGESWDEFVAFAVEHNFAGVECLSGIPGSVGATPVQNVGAYGQEVAETIDSVLVLDLRDGQVRELCNEACGFSYRTSIFNTSDRGRFVILRVNFKLEESGEPRVAYADLKRYFENHNARPTLAEVRRAVRTIRAGKGMLIMTDDDDSRSAGSFFKNPVLSDEDYKLLQQRAAERGLTVPNYPALNAFKKISAAWLVENAGFSKGYSRGSVGISHKHALAIVNRGAAKAADIVALENEIQDRVAQHWGVHLEPEPVFVGF
ncbi:MAG TPA: UDP-N-acetylmuramate dehydrogenase [Terriglobales bacterium]|nr:UDP-N-acetylmuramate dehydrogenase [Terriglobales bacterium]